MTTDAKPEPADKPAAKPQAKRRWCQFSLWAMFVWVTVIGALLAAGMLWVAPAQKQRTTVQMIERVGGSFRYADPAEDETPLKRRLRSWLPRDYFDAVQHVYLAGACVADADLRFVGSLTQLQSLSLRGVMQLTDSGLAQLTGLTQLHGLSLENTKVTNAGLTHMKNLIELQELNLEGTLVTDAGVAELQTALPNCHIRH